MRVVSLFNETHEIPDILDPSDPVLQRLKKLVELEFYKYFDRKIEITNWEYILKRASVYTVNVCI
jgi:hypothetical protein